MTEWWTRLRTTARPGPSFDTAWDRWAWRAGLAWDPTAAVASGDHHGRPVRLVFHALFVGITLDGTIPLPDGSLAPCVASSAPWGSAALHQRLADALSGCTAEVRQWRMVVVGPARDEQTLQDRLDVLVEAIAALEQAPTTALHPVALPELFSADLELACRAARRFGIGTGLATKLRSPDLPIGGRRIALLALDASDDAAAIAAGVVAALDYDLLVPDVLRILERRGVTDGSGSALEAWLDRHPAPHPLESRVLRLILMNGASEVHLLRALGGVDAETRDWAIEGLGEVGTADCLPTLRALAGGSVLRSDVRLARAALDRVRGRITTGGLSLAAPGGGLSLARSGELSET